MTTHACKPGRQPRFVNGKIKYYVHEIYPGMIWKCPDCRAEWVAIKRGEDIVWRERRLRNIILSRLNSRLNP